MDGTRWFPPFFFHVWCWMNHPTDRENHFQHRGCFRCQVYQFAQQHILLQRKEEWEVVFDFFFWRGSLKFHTKNCHKRDNKWDVQDVWPSDFVCIICILDIMGTTHEHVDLPRQITHQGHHFFYFFSKHRLKQIQANTTRFVVSSRLFVAKFYTKLVFWGECSKNFHERSSCLPTEIMSIMNGMYFRRGHQITGFRVIKQCESIFG